MKRHALLWIWLAQIKPQWISGASIGLWVNSVSHAQTLLSPAVPGFSLWWVCRETACCSAAEVDCDLWFGHKNWLTVSGRDAPQHKMSFVKNSWQELALTFFCKEGFTKREVSADTCTICSPELSDTLGKKGGLEGGENPGGVCRSGARAEVTCVFTVQTSAQSAVSADCCTNRKQENTGTTRATRNTVPRLDKKIVPNQWRQPIRGRSRSCKKAVGAIITHKSKTSSPQQIQMQNLLWIYKRSSSLYVCRCNLDETNFILTMLYYTPLWLLHVKLTNIFMFGCLQLHLVIWEDQSKHGASHHRTSGEVLRRGVSNTLRPLKSASWAVPPRGFVPTQWVTTTDFAKVSFCPKNWTEGPVETYTGHSLQEDLWEETGYEGLWRQALWRGS